MQRQRSRSRSRPCETYNANVVGAYKPKASLTSQAGLEAQKKKIETHSPWNANRKTDDRQAPPSDRPLRQSGPTPKGPADPRARLQGQSTSASNFTWATSNPSPKIQQQSRMNNSNGPPRAAGSCSTSTTPITITQQRIPITPKRSHSRMVMGIEDEDDDADEDNVADASPPNLYTSNKNKYVPVTAHRTLSRNRRSVSRQPEIVPVKTSQANGSLTNRSIKVERATDLSTPKHRKTSTARIHDSDDDSDSEPRRERRSSSKGFATKNVTRSRSRTSTVGGIVNGNSSITARTRNNNQRVVDQPWLVQQAAQARQMPTDEGAQRWLRGQFALGAEMRRFFEVVLPTKAREVSKLQQRWRGVVEDVGDLVDGQHVMPNGHSAN